MARPVTMAPVAEAAGVLHECIARELRITLIPVSGDNDATRVTDVDVADYVVWAAAEDDSIRYQIPISAQLPQMTTRCVLVQPRCCDQFRRGDCLTSRLEDTEDLLTGC
ncbi:hypothetical protein SAMN06309944_2030 [Micrococcales bacterium KH10]|nr:hypothetical protein SAMN06309944_2030 [Micrococcales bacterium KH10]